MATWNRSRFLGKGIQSVIGQSLKDWELIVVNDGSTDNTDEVMRGWQHKDARIKYVPIAHIGKIAAVSNAGLRAANGEFIAVLDDDDWWIDPKKLEKQVAFLRAHPDYAACGSGFVMVDEAGKETGRVRKPEKDDAIRATALSANPVANSTAMFRRSLGVFYDESMRQFADWDFWLTVGKKGKLYNFPEYFLAYRMWEKSASFMYQKINVNAAFRIIKKHKGEYPGFTKAFFLTSLYWCYARLPLFIRRNLNAALSRIKKRIFSR